MQRKIHFFDRNPSLLLLQLQSLRSIGSCSDSNISKHSWTKLTTTSTRTTFNHASLPLNQGAFPNKVIIHLLKSDRASTNSQYPQEWPSWRQMKLNFFWDKGVPKSATTATTNPTELRCSHTEVKRNKISHTKIQKQSLEVIESEFCKNWILSLWKGSWLRYIVLRS